MKHNNRSFPTLRILAGALAVTGALLSAPLDARAVMPSKGAVILNVVSVSYTDTANNPFSANAAATVTVELLPSALNVTGPNGTGAPSCPPTPVNSGGTSRVMNAVVATANGDDTYALDITGVTGTDVANEAVTFSVYDSAGTALFNNVATASLANFGSAIIVGSSGANVLRFDGGVNLAAMFSPGDIVVVNGVAYKIAAGGVSNGTAVSHDNDGGGNYSATGNTNNANAYGTLTLEAFQVTIGGNTYGTNAAPSFDNTTPVTAGDVAGEMVLVQVSVTADSSSQSSDGTVAFNFDTDNTNGDTTSNPCSVTFNRAATVSIQKLVRNTSGGPFAATATGQPGDTLEYQVTVVNPSVSNALNVIVTDAVPAYTTLVVSGGNIASASLNGGPVVSITQVDTDDEDTSVASGNAAGTTAGSAMTFYLGASNADTTNTGGTLIQDDDVVITYQVTIDN